MYFYVIYLWEYAEYVVLGLDFVLRLLKPQPLPNLSAVISRYNQMRK